MNLFFHIVGPFLLLIFLNFNIYMKIKEFEAVTPGALKIHFKQVHYDKRKKQARIILRMETDRQKGGKLGL